MGREGRQTTLCVPLEVRPASRARLCAILDEVHRHPETYDRVPAEVPVLHFLSLSVFDHVAYDPQFVLEANFDGSPRVFWGQVEAAFGPSMREILRCCKPPLDQDRALYEAVTAAGSRAPVAPYFEARTEWPSVFHHGNRGLTRDRILAEARLFEAVRDEIDGDWPKYRALDPAAVQAMLRRRLMPAFPWLEAPPPQRIGPGERVLDALELLAFVVLLGLALSAPGIAVGFLLPWRLAAGLVLVVAAVASFRLWRSRDPLPGTAVPTAFRLWRTLLPWLWAILGYIVAATVVLLPVFLLVTWLLAIFEVGAVPGFREAAVTVGTAVAIGVLSLAATMPLLVYWLRWLERRDSSQDAPPVDESARREMLRREDWIAQNHMGSIVLIRPGVLRMLGIRIGHLGLGLVLRVTATSGYLGSMRTVHFAHWAFLNNRSRLMFMSNFDHSWGSYLDDFIEKAHSGLTLAWGAGVGFPPTRFLLYDGASHGRKFKAWALASRAVSRVWFSAYRTLTVDQIERNFRIALGLRKPRLSSEEAVAWMEDL